MLSATADTPLSLAMLDLRNKYFNFFQRVNCCATATKPSSPIVLTPRSRCPRLSPQPLAIARASPSDNSLCDNWRNERLPSVPSTHNGNFVSELRAAATDSNFTSARTSLAAPSSPKPQDVTSKQAADPPWKSTECKCANSFGPKIAYEMSTWSAAPSGNIRIPAAGIRGATTVFKLPGAAPASSGLDPIQRWTNVSGSRGNVCKRFHPARSVDNDTQHGACKI
mmetsp:Transcript_41688/g.109806  ORF Transcript_41688/g.109806 Transcript_41688/m.109806 type:complete len:224 (-) Transcript_41688:98-769(-)